MTLKGKKIIYLISEDWYFCSHRLDLGIAAKKAGADVLVATQINKHGTEIEAAGLRVVPIMMQRSGHNPIADLMTIKQITQLYRYEKPDLVHHVALKPILYGGIAAKLAAVPAVVNAVAGMGFMFISESVFARMVRPFIIRAQSALMNCHNTHTILQNPDDKALYTEIFGVARERITIIPGAGVDIDKFSVAPEPEGTPIAVCVSRMLRDKGIYELVAAARLLREKGISLVVRLVGPTDDNPASIPKQVLNKWSDDGIVEIAGPSDNIAGEYARAHIAVLPSYREGLPKSLVEAASCGRPIVATDVPGCREVCIEGETGYRVPPYSVEPLADALERLAINPDLRRQFGENARLRAESNFAADTINLKTIATYEALLDKL